MMKALLFILLLPPGIIPQNNQMEWNREKIKKHRESDGPNRDIAIFVRNLSDNVTTSESYMSWGHYTDFSCGITTIGDENESVCYFEKKHHTATGVSGVITFSLGLVTGSYVAVIFSVPFNRISACNWFGVYVVERPADEDMYNDLYGKKAYKYTHSDTPTWINVTDGGYSVNVTMTHSTTCDMEIIMSGKGETDTDLVVAMEPITAKIILAVINLITAFTQLATKILDKKVEPKFESAVAIKVEVYNHNLAEPVTISHYVARGKYTFKQDVAPPNGTATWMFAKADHAAMGVRTVLTLRSEEWNTPEWDGRTVWLYIDISWSGFYSNYYGFHISNPSLASLDGEKKVEKFYAEKPSEGHVIYVPNQERRFATTFYKGSGGYVIEGVFRSPKITTLSISVMKVDEVYYSLMRRLGTGLLDHLNLCQPPTFYYCIHYHAERIEKLSGMNSQEVKHIRSFKKS